MSATELIKLVGERTGGKNTASLRVEVFSIKVKLLHVKQVFGRVDVLVTPIEGDGQRWVQAGRLSEIKEDSHE